MRSMRQPAIYVATAAAFTLMSVMAAFAQSEPAPGYIVVEINVKDLKGFQEYAEKATRTIEQYGGSFVTLGERVETIEGPAPTGTFVIIKFDSVDDARKWLNSPEYSAVKSIRHRTADARQYLVEGLPGS